MKPKVYLAGQWNQYENNWKEEFKKINNFDFYDPEFNSDQSSPDAFYQQDLTAIKNSDILIANPGLAPSEATWVEIGYFLSLNTKVPGEKCSKLIIIWPKERLPWSIEFVKKVGVIAETVEEAKKHLSKLV